MIEKYQFILDAIDFDNRAEIIFDENIKYSYWEGARHGQIMPIHIAYIGKSFNDICHAILHECCHVIIEEKNIGKQNIHLWYTKYLYLREYKVEKLVRRFCRKYNWNGILYESNVWVKQFINIKRGDPLLAINFMNQYIYASKRIKREEKLNKNKYESRKTTTNKRTGPRNYLG